MDFGKLGLFLLWYFCTQSPRWCLVQFPSRNPFCTYLLNNTHLWPETRVRFFRLLLNPVDVLLLDPVIGLLLLNPVWLLLRQRWRALQPGGRLRHNGSGGHLVLRVVARLRLLLLQHSTAAAAIVAAFAAFQRRWRLKRMDDGPRLEQRRVLGRCGRRLLWLRRDGFRFLSVLQAEPATPEQR